MLPFNFNLHLNSRLKVLNSLSVLLFEVVVVPYVVKSGCHVLRGHLFDSLSNGQFFLIVPDSFTMVTQLTIVTGDPEQHFSLHIYLLLF
jgi:hypothetical protein